MAFKSLSTEQRGLNAVMAHEKAQGRTPERVHKCGYDIVSRDQNGERHIEVKATVKASFAFRWLEELEHKSFKNDENFYLYLVTEVESEKPKIRIYQKQDLEQRFSRLINHYVFDFSKDDFNG